jgi:hypothetical protein
MAEWIECLPSKLEALSSTLLPSKKTPKKLYPFLIPNTKINYKRVLYLNIRAKTINPFKENIEVNICEFGLVIP